MCATPETPTTNGLTNGPTGLWQKIKALFGALTDLAVLAKFIGNLSRQNQPEDPKRLGLFLQAVGLLIGFLAISGAITYRILEHGDVGSGAIWSLAVVGTLFTGGQVIAHFKPDAPFGGDVENLQAKGKGIQDPEGRAR